MQGDHLDVLPQEKVRFTPFSFALSVQGKEGRSITDAEAFWTQRDLRFLDALSLPDQILPKHRYQKEDG